MTNGLLKILSIPIVALPLFFSSSFAAVGVIIDWGPDCYGWETNYAGHYSTAGDTLSLLGRIHTFNAPFDDLDPNVVEYTFVWDGLISAGTDDFGGAGIWMTAYGPGEFRIYCDSTPDYDFANQGTFMNGEIILSGNITDLTSTVIDGVPPMGSANFSFLFTGGTLYERVAGCGGVGTGFWGDTLFPIGIPDPYDVHYDGKYDLDDCPPVGTESSTWGEVKKLFH
jgi:hypothetical protein